MAHISNQELRIKNLDIPLYANTAPALAPHYEAKRKRKLLLKAQEIGKIAGLLDKP
jgi:tmRNA-binding protein